MAGVGFNLPLLVDDGLGESEKDAAPELIEDEPPASETDVAAPPVELMDEAERILDAAPPSTDGAEQGGGVR